MQQSMLPQSHNHGLRRGGRPDLRAADEKGVDVAPGRPLARLVRPALDLLRRVAGRLLLPRAHQPGVGKADIMTVERSEEHTSELQSLMRISYAVFCLTKKTNKERNHLTLYGQEPDTTLNFTQLRSHQLWQDIVSIVALHSTELRIQFNPIRSKDNSNNLK